MSEHSSAGIVSSGPSVFPPEFRFRFRWRPYQQKVLNDLASYLANGRLHVVAAPGSGKTVLGLEAVRELGKPTLILCPTLTIREQWIERLREGFLPEGAQTPDWVSRIPTKPNLITVSTYQAIHYAWKGHEESREDDDSDQSDESNSPDEPDDLESSDMSSKSNESDSFDLPALLKTASIATIVLDECHHLKASWWRALTDLKQKLDNPAVVALTATPPYDVNYTEWARYQEMCGPVDVEVSAPEMVMEGNLCPHQDYVCFNLPSETEASAVAEFRAHANELFDSLCGYIAFSDAVSEHPWLKDPGKHIEEILGDPQYFSSLLIYTNHTRLWVSSGLTRILGVTKENLPLFSLSWAEVLLTHALFSDCVRYAGWEATLDHLRSELRRIGAIERNQVTLQESNRLNKLLVGSVNKMESVVRIVRSECTALGADLRMVILTDYIRKSELAAAEFDLSLARKLGAATVFDLLRREAASDFALGGIRNDACADLSRVVPAVLSGTLVIIPSVALPRLRELVFNAGVEDSKLSAVPLASGPLYLEVAIIGTAGRLLVSLVSQLFEEGQINVLVGTKALLGEGWDAPCANSLILASTVGSFVLSNQMRGRAIRSWPKDPDKAANIWHLVCLDKTASGGGDYRSLERRFRAFAGTSADGERIENGIGRLGLGDPVFEAARIQELNARTFSLSQDRAGLRARWEAILRASGPESAMVEQVKTKKPKLPRKMVYLNTVSSIIGQTALLAGVSGLGLAWFTGAAVLGSATAVLGVGLIVISAATFPGFIRALRLYRKHGAIESSMQQVGLAVLDGLQAGGQLHTERARLTIRATMSNGTATCWLEGGTSFEQAIFVTCLCELFDPIENPRYVLFRYFLSEYGGTEDYYAVPGILGAKKEIAEAFAKAWKRHVGPTKLLFTRTQEGRRHLLAARRDSLSGALTPNTDSGRVWR